MDLIPDRPHWERRMSRGLRRNNTIMEDNEEDNRAGIGEPESEMMGVVRALMAEQRRAEAIREDARLEREAAEARRQEELQAESVRRQAEIQAAAETRQFEQQVALLRIQAEMGEKAGQAHRELQSSDRRRDRALFSIPVLKEGEDVEEFLMTAEKRLSAAEVKR